LKFFEFGVNNSNSAKQATFVVRKESNKSIIYSEAIGSRPLDEIVSVSASAKAQKVIEWLIPVSAAEGKYKLFTSYDGTTPKKLIGVFFVTPDTTAPEVRSIDNLTTYTNQQESVGYTVIDTAQPDSVRAQQIGIGSDLSSMAIKYDPNHSSSLFSTTDNPVTIQYAAGNSGNKTLRIQATDLSGNTGFKDIPVSVFVNDNEAYNIIKARCEAHGLFDIGGKDTETDSVGTWDVYSPGANLRIEYRSSQNGSSDTTDFTSSEWDAVINNTIDRAKGINPCNAADLATKVDQILTDLGY
jgi:hypothetical protein